MGLEGDSFEKFQLVNLFPSSPIQPAWLDLCSFFPVLALNSVKVKFKLFPPFSLPPFPGKWKVNTGNRNEKRMGLCQCKSKFPFSPYFLAKRRRELPGRGKKYEKVRRTGREKARDPGHMWKESFPSSLFFFLSRILLESGWERAEGEISAEALTFTYRFDLSLNEKEMNSGLSKPASAHSLKLQTYEILKRKSWVLLDNKTRGESRDESKSGMQYAKNESECRAWRRRTVDIKIPCQ